MSSESRVLTAREKKMLEGFAVIIQEYEPTSIVNPFRYIQQNGDLCKSMFRKAKSEKDKQLGLILWDVVRKEERRINVMTRPYPHRIFLLFCKELYLNYQQCQRLLEKLKESENV